MKMSLTRCLSIACISYPPRQYPESLRQPPDTSQTPSRHPKIRHMLTNPRQLGYKKPASIDQSIGCVSIACTSYPTDSKQSHSSNPQTPRKHFPDNLQTFRGTWERRNQLIKITLIGFTSYPHPTPPESLRQPKTLRHHPDTPKSINIGAVKGTGKNFLPLLGKALRAVVEYNDIFQL